MGDQTPRCLQEWHIREHMFPFYDSNVTAKLRDHWVGRPGVERVRNVVCHSPSPIVQIGPFIVSWKGLTYSCIYILVFLLGQVFLLGFLSQPQYEHIVLCLGAFLCIVVNSPFGLCPINAGSILLIQGNRQMSPDAVRCSWKIKTIPSWESPFSVGVLLCVSGRSQTHSNPLASAC